MHPPNDIRDLKFSNSDTSFYLNQIKVLQELFKTRSFISPQTESFIKENLEMLMGFIPFLSTTVYFGEPFQRVVINKYVREDKRNTRLQNTYQIKYPPPEVAKNLYYTLIPFGNQIS